MLVGLTILLLLRGRAAAKPFDLGGQDWEGIKDFVTLAQEELGARIVPSGSVAFDQLSPADALVLLHPEVALDDTSLVAFVRAGGRVVLLDDYGKGESLLEAFAIERVRLPARPAQDLRHNPELAIAEPVAEHPVARGVDRVVLNHATGLRNPKLSSVLRVRGEGEPDVDVALAGALGRGRLLAVGDPSIVINSMLRYPGNATFARNMVRYAAADDSGKPRGGKVYVTSGGFRQHGSFAGAARADTWSALFRDLFASIRESGLPPWTLYFLGVTLGLGVVLWVGANAGRLHRPARPRYTRAIPLTAQGGAAGRAAVVGAKGASRALALLEIKSAVEEDLALLLGLDRVPTPDVLVAGAGKAELLDKEGLRALRELLLRLSNVETLMLSRRTDPLRRIRDREVVVTANNAKELLSKAHAAYERRAARFLEGGSAA